MAVHSFLVFDRRGKTLFTKRYGAASSKASGASAEDEEQLSEQRKLVFGMLFSLRELVGSMTPETEVRKNAGLHSVRTGASTLHNFETANGLRFALFTSNSKSQSRQEGDAIHKALSHIYTEIWVDSVVRSPLYKASDSFDVSTTNFEQKLDAYLAGMPWFR